MTLRMAGSIPTPSLSGTIKTVRKLLSKSSQSPKELCSIINSCASNHSQRYVLSSVDSVFDGLPPTLLRPPDSKEERNLLKNALFKIPRALYVPRISDAHSSGPDLGAIIDNLLEEFTSKHPNFHDYAIITKELCNTVEFMAEHSINGLYGPLRDSALCMLKCYKEALLSDTNLGDLKKLTLAAQLFNVMKLHSIDSEDLRNLILELIAKTPSIVRQCNLATLDTLVKMKLPAPHKSELDEHLRMNSAKFKDVEEWSEFFWMVARNSDNRNTIDCYLQSYKIVLRNQHPEGKVKRISSRAIMNTVFGVRTLQKRLKHTDPVSKNALIVLESLWPFIEENIASLEPTELVEIAECYFENHRQVNPLMKHGSRNCLDFLVSEASKRSNEFLLRDWIALIESLECVRDFMAVNVLMEKPSNYYVKVEEIQKGWVARIADILKQSDLNDAADSIYSLPLPLCSNLCKHLVISGLYEEPLRSIIERRCLSLITDVRYQTKRHVYDFYFVQLQMVLPSQCSLRVALEGNKPLRDLLSRMSGQSILKLLRLAKYCRPAECRLLLQKLSERIESGVLDLTQQQRIRVLKQAVDFKDNNLINAVIASVAPQLLSAGEPHKGFSQILDLSRFSMALPKIDVNDQSASALLNELIVRHAPAHVHHLSLLHLDLLLQNIKRSGTFPQKLIGDILSHSMDVDIMGITPLQASNVLDSLSELGIRHESLVERLEDSILLGLVDLENEAAATVLSKVANSIARIGMKSTRLSELFDHIVKLEEVPISLWNYEALELKTKTKLLHAMSRLVNIDASFEQRFRELIEQCESCIHNSGDAVSFTKLDDEGYRQLYDIYITVVINGVQTETSKSEFLQEHLPCYHWFKHQEQLCSEFKGSPHYVQLKNTLDRIGIGNAEARVTEAYFAHMVLAPSEGETTKAPGSTLLYVVPPKDELRWWTTKSDAGTDMTVNRIESYKYTIGQSAWVIGHLQRSGWNVITIFLPEWDSMTAAQRETYLRDVLKLNK